MGLTFKRLIGSGQRRGNENVSSKHYDGETRPATPKRRIARLTYTRSICRRDADWELARHHIAGAGCVERG